MEDRENGYSREEILEQLRKIAEAEDKLYGGKQMSFDFNPKAETESTEKSDIGNSQESIDAQPDIDFDALADGSEDPVKLKKLWHGSQGLIISNTQKGKGRQFALDEKKLFLKASANTTDSKFSFINAVQTVYDMAEQWVRSNGDIVELGMAYWDLNERKGYHSHKTQSGFNAKLKALLNVPPPRRNRKSKGDDDSQEPELEPVA